MFTEVCIKTTCWRDFLWDNHSTKYVSSMSPVRNFLRTAHILETMVIVAIFLKMGSYSWNDNTSYDMTPFQNFIFFCSRNLLYIDIIIVDTSEDRLKLSEKMFLVDKIAMINTSQFFLGRHYNSTKLSVNFGLMYTLC